LKKKSSEFSSASKKDIFMKNAIQVAVLLLSTGTLAQAQDAGAVAEKAAPAAGEIQVVTVTSTGTRGKQRTSTDTPVPIDIMSASELTKTAQVSLDKALQYRVPSFSTVQTPVNDATSLLDPYEIRNMGPSRALILINGKRKNSSSLVYTQTSPGRGESGADISAIPQDAIKRIEILRDGASAQYGSDAIAGVVNIILKDDAEGTSITGRTGRTAKGDGKSNSISLNHGLALGDRGFVNFTVDLSHNELANRPGILSAADEAGYWGADLAYVTAFLKKKPDGGNINGSPDTKASKFLVNSRYEVADGVNVYANAAYVDKKVDSYANYRAPYWKTEVDTHGLFNHDGTYDGYVPGFLGSLKDYNATIGTKFDVAGWASDVSLTIGGNQQRYTVTNSINFTMADEYAAAVAAGTTPLPPQSPHRFDAGGTDFSHTVWNADFSKQISPDINAYFGSEIRSEKYTIVAGDAASSYGAGANSYAGNSPRDAGTFTRSNFGIYGGASFDVTKKLVVDVTGREEKYSDFGNAFVGKVASKYSIDDNLTLRGSASTGFRAPSLHQIYTQKKEYSFSGNTIQIAGLASNVSSEVDALGIPRLKAEKSTNFTLGLGFKMDRDTSMTFDYYNIALKDRIVLSESISGSSAPEAKVLNDILLKNGIVSLKFFSNAIDSKTSGIDYVFNHKNMDIAGGKLGFNVAGNYVLQNERTGVVHNVASIAAAGQSVFGPTQDALMFTSRPKFKTIIGMDLDYQDINFSLNNTVFGPTKFRNADIDQNLSVVFKTKTLTDFGINYQLTKNMTLAFNINNMFDVTPSWHFEAVADVAKGQAILNDPAKTHEQWQNATFDGRYPMVTYDGSHFSQLGRTYNLSLNYRF
jgi:iron complex outermembrane receptor protein